MASDVYAPTYLSVRDVAALTKLSVKTVLRRIHSGELKAAKFGHDWRIHVNDYESWTRASG